MREIHRSRNTRDDGAEILAAWADIIAGAMMKEKASAHFARNDGAGKTAPGGRAWREARVRFRHGADKF
jgi:hypothetical protein